MGKIRIGIIGAGAAGYFAAVHASAAHTEVTILEKTSKSLAKVKVSGGGRCNVTHAAYEISHLTRNYPRGEKFLKKVFHHFSVPDTINWFESRGVKLKTESDGRVFPMSDSSQSVIDALEIEAEKRQVQIIYHFAVHKIQKIEGAFEVSGKEGRLFFDRVIICTGGFPKLEGFEFLKPLVHNVIDPIPSLFTFNTPQEPIRNLMGISLPEALVKLEGTKLLYKGPLLITHWGVSGPAVLKLSAFGAKWLFDKNYKANAHIRWQADWSEDFLTAQMGQFQRNHPKRKIIGNPLFGLPARLWEHLVEKSEITAGLLWQNLPKKNFHKLLQNLFCYIVRIDGKTTFKEEFVTAGGVDLLEVDPETMMSLRCPHLYFAGEVLDIDGITGGFNFQAAWSTGYLAGKSASQ